jgi:hypothetical protein
MKRIHVAILAILALASSVIIAHATGSLEHTQGVLYSSGDPIQQCSPQATLPAKTLGTKYFANYTTASLNCMDVYGYTGTQSVPSQVPIKFRIGGFVTGTETDFGIVGSAGKIFWPASGVAKIGFQAFSSANNTTKVSGASR